MHQKRFYDFNVWSERKHHAIMESASKSISYWSTGNGDDTMVTLWNPADEAQDFLFSLAFSGGHYGLPIHLAAREIRTFNVSEIIQNQVPDSEGNIIPSAVHEGSMKIAGSRADNQSILVAMDAGTYNVRKATCGPSCIQCNGVVSTSLTPNPFFVEIENATDFLFTDTWGDGISYNLTDVAQWGGSSNVSAGAGGIVTGVSAGSATVGAGYASEPIDVWVCGFTGDPCPVGFGASGSTSGNVGDPTPVVNSVSPSVWNAGTTTLGVIITGTGFGTAPQLTLSDTSIGVQIISSADAQIVANVTVGASAPSETVTVTVTSTGYNGSGFIGGGGEPSSGSNTANVVPFSPPAPRILFNGTDVTGGAAQPVVVGQQIALTTSVSLPSGVSVTQNNWSVPGTTVGGYVNAARNGPPDTTGGQTIASVFTNSSTTFYWVSPGQSMAVTYSYCLNTGPPCSPTATATFNVAAGPTGVNVKVTPGTVNVNNNGPGPDLQLGGSLQNLGIDFVVDESKASIPPSDKGAYLWVQVITTLQDKFRLSSGTQTCTDPAGLDNSYPLPAGNCTSPPGSGNPCSFNDNPDIPLVSSRFETTKTLALTTYLMWDPAIPPIGQSSCTPAKTCASIPVPLGYVNWSYGSDAINTLSPQSNGTTWVKNSNCGSVNGSPTFTPQAQYPEWNSTIMNGTPFASCVTTP